MSKIKFQVNELFTFEAQILKGLRDLPHIYSQCHYLAEWPGTVTDTVKQFFANPDMNWISDLFCQIERKIKL